MCIFRLRSFCQFASKNCAMDISVLLYFIPLRRPPRMDETFPGKTHTKKDVYTTISPRIFHLRSFGQFAGKNLRNGYFRFIIFYFIYFVSLDKLVVLASTYKSCR